MTKRRKWRINPPPTACWRIFTDGIANAGAWVFFLCLVFERCARSVFTALHSHFLNRITLSRLNMIGLSRTTARFTKRTGAECFPPFPHCFRELVGARLSLMYLLPCCFASVASVSRRSRPTAQETVPALHDRGFCAFDRHIVFLPFSDKAIIV